MIDLHCHILPGLDDGALDLHDSIAMARTAAADGVEAICATPHIRHDHDVLPHEIAARVVGLNDALSAVGVPLRVLPGAELAAPALECLNDDELRAITLGGGGRWILLEPAPGPLDSRLDAAMASLTARGFRALIALQQRHLGDDPRERLGRLVAEHGALVQGTAALLVDPCTRDAMLALARDGLVHVLGSDAHSSHGGRSTQLAAAFEALGGVVDHVEWMAREAPRAILRGDAVVAAPFAAVP